MNTKTQFFRRPRTGSPAMGLMKRLFGKEVTANGRTDIMDRISYCMDREKPYLDPDFTLEKLCRMVLSNTTTVSNAINKEYGMNFRRVINTRRSEYAYGLIEKNPEMDLHEVMRRSGFRSMDTFKLSFLMVYGINPKECRIRMRFPGLRHPSNSKG